MDGFSVPSYTITPCGSLFISSINERSLSVKGFSIVISYSGPLPYADVIAVGGLQCFFTFLDLKYPLPTNSFSSLPSTEQAAEIAPAHIIVAVIVAQDCIGQSGSYAGGCGL